MFSEQLFSSQPLLLAVERIFNEARRSVDSKREAFRGPNSSPFYLSTDSCAIAAVILYHGSNCTRVGGKIKWARIRAPQNLTFSVKRPPCPVKKSVLKQQWLEAIVQKTIASDLVLLLSQRGCVWESSERLGVKRTSTVQRGDLLKQQ